MINITTVIRGPVLSGTDRTRSASTGRFLTASDHQHRLAAIYDELRKVGTFGPGGERVINDISYLSLFSDDWMVTVDVQVMLGSRSKHQLPDIDNLWRDFQNALAFPAEGLRVAPPETGQPLYTVVVDDRQFTRFSVTRVPDPMVSRDGDLIIAQFAALPPPALRIMLTQ